ncbi:MAG: EpsG family protein [Oscillospiraceae bacterium]|jgi:transmembrane protein EpsG|nr:EpsG family protein [Oscillospiraceae bacterium]
MFLPSNIKLHVILAVLCAAAWMAQQLPVRRSRLLQNSVPNPIGYVAVAVPLILFSGLRGNYGDTLFYRHSYILQLEKGVGKPAGWFHGNGLFSMVQYWCATGKELVHNGEPVWGQLMLLVISMCFLIPAVWVLYRYADGYAMAVFFFFATGTFMSSMNGIRQYAAAGILLMATRFLFEDNLWHGLLRYLPFCVLAWTMHSSALVMIPIFFVVRFRAFSWMSYLMLAGSVLAVLGSSFIMPGFLSSLKDTEFSVYATGGWFNSTDGVNILRVAAVLAPLVPAYLLRDDLQALGRQGDILINLNFLNAAIYVIGLYNWIFVRFTIYLSIYHVLLLCKLFSILKKKMGAMNIYSLGGMAAYFYYSSVANYDFIDFSNYWFPWLNTIH